MARALFPGTRYASARLLGIAAVVLAVLWGGYALVRHMGVRTIDVCVVTDTQYRLRKPDWETAIGPVFRKVNDFFAAAGVHFQVKTGGDAYPDTYTADMPERWRVLGENTCKADLVVGFTGQTDREIAIAPPFSHAVLIKDTGANPEAILAITISRALANAFGVPVSLEALFSVDAASSEFFDRSSTAMVHDLRDFDFGRGPAALPGRWERRAVSAIAVARAGRTAAPEAEAHQIVARAFAAARMYGDSARHLREAVRIAPKNADLRFELAMSLRSNAQPEQAIAELREAVRLNPDDAIPHAALGTLYLNANRIDAAVEQWRAAAALDPRNAAFQVALGEALSKRPGLIQNAAAAFEAAAQLRPAELAAYAGMSRQNVVATQLGQEVQSAEAEARARPESADAHAKLARLYGAAGKFGNARNEAQRALDLQPKNGEAHAVLAELAVLTGDYATAAAEAAAARAAGAPVRRELVSFLEERSGLLPPQ